jgi:hypothetical protein
MADRLTVQEFFEALREQKISPLVDAPAQRCGRASTRGCARSVPGIPSRSCRETELVRAALLPNQRLAQCRQTTRKRIRRVARSWNAF